MLKKPGIIFLTIVNIFMIISSVSRFEGMPSAYQIIFALGFFNFSDFDRLFFLLFALIYATIFSFVLFMVRARGESAALLNIWPSLTSMILACYYYVSLYGSFQWQDIGIILLLIAVPPFAATLLLEAVNRLWVAIVRLHIAGRTQVRGPRPHRSADGGPRTSRIRAASRPRQRA